MLYWHLYKVTFLKKNFFYYKNIICIYNKKKYSHAVFIKSTSRFLKFYYFFDFLIKSSRKNKINKNKINKNIINKILLSKTKVFSGFLTKNFLFLGGFLRVLKKYKRISQPVPVKKGKGKTNKTLKPKPLNVTQNVYHSFFYSQLPTINKNEKMRNSLKYKKIFLIRPLLSVSRDKTKTLSNFWNSPLFPDKTNFQLKYSRNRIRYQLLPTLKFLFNPKLNNSLLEFVEITTKQNYNYEFKQKYILQSNKI